MRSTRPCSSRSAPSSVATSPKWSERTLSSRTEIGPTVSRPSARARLSISTNDPDAGHNPLELHLIADNTPWGLEVGDSIEGVSEFAALLPGGVEALRGNVTVLAYFALF